MREEMESGNFRWWALEREGRKMIEGFSMDLKKILFGGGRERMVMVIGDVKGKTENRRRR